MSWRGSTGHLDANVPDYQKMLQGHYPSSGWSSTPSAYSSYSHRSHGSGSHSGSYLSPRQNTSSYGRQGYSSQYQPSKYGLPSDSYNTSVDPNFKTLEIDDSSATFRSENGNGFDKNYGIVSREFNLEPFRSSSNRVTDYSSDSGRGHVPHPTTDYSSDSGMGFRSHRRKSSEFELEIPSPETSRSRPRSQNEELFSSPVKSQFPVSDYLRLTDSQTSLHNHRSQDHLPEFHLGSRNDSSLDQQSRTQYRDTEITKNGHEHLEKESAQNEKTSPRVDNHSHDIENNGSNNEDENIVRANFMSPPLYKGNIGETTLIHRDAKPPRNRGSDLTHWQQTQRAEPSVIDQGSQRHPSHHKHHTEGSYRGHTHDTYHRRDNTLPRRHTARDVTSPKPHDSHHMSSAQHTSEQMLHIRSAADAIIRDKDAIIDELRGQVLTMEERVKEYENKLRRSLMSRGNNSEEAVSFSKMQELEYRNAELRTDLTKLKLQKDTEVEDLEIKLGGVEHEVEQLKTALRKTQPNTAEIKDKLVQRDEEIGEWKMKYSQLNDTYDGLKDKLDGLERYLSDLPTIDEFNKNAEELTSYREDNAVKKEQIIDLEERLSETTQMLSDRETTIQQLEGKQHQLAGKMRELSTEMKHIKSEGQGKALSLAQGELAETKEIKDRVILDLEKAKKLLEMNHRRVRQLEVKHQTDIRAVQERLGQEEEAVMALREEARLKEEQVAKLKKSLKDFANKNQDLMDESLILKEQLRHYEETSEDENQQLQRRFVKEMSLCFAELQSLVQICVQRAEGKDPNISLLLGMRGSSLDDDDDDEGAVGGAKREEQTLKHWFSKLKELRAEVEKVRKMICNKYAEEMGDNLNCATQ